MKKIYQKPRLGLTAMDTSDVIMASVAGGAYGVEIINPDPYDML